MKKNQSQTEGQAFELIYNRWKKKNPNGTPLNFFREMFLEKGAKNK